VRDAAGTLRYEDLNTFYDDSCDVLNVFCEKANRSAEEAFRAFATGGLTEFGELAGFVAAADCMKTCTVKFAAHLGDYDLDEAYERLQLQIKDAMNEMCDQAVGTLRKNDASLYVTGAHSAAGTALQRQNSSAQRQSLKSVLETFHRFGQIDRTTGIFQHVSKPNFEMLRDDKLLASTKQHFERVHTHMRELRFTDIDPPSAGITDFVAVGECMRQLQQLRVEPAIGPVTEEAYLKIVKQVIQNIDAIKAFAERILQKATAELPDPQAAFDTQQFLCCLDALLCARTNLSALPSDSMYTNQFEDVKGSLLDYANALMKQFDEHINSNEWNIQEAHSLCSKLCVLNCAKDSVPALQNMAAKATSDLGTKISDEFEQIKDVFSASDYNPCLGLNDQPEDLVHAFQFCATCEKLRTVLPNGEKHAVELSFTIEAIQKACERMRGELNQHISSLWRDKVLPNGDQEAAQEMADLFQWLVRQSLFHGTNPTPAPPVEGEGEGVLEVEVECPAGCAEGDDIEVTGSDGRVVTVVVPPGVTAQGC
jgi:hypothetical protein